MGFWEDITDAYSGLEPQDIFSVGDWLTGYPSEYEIPNFAKVNPLYGTVTGWGASPEEKANLSNQMREGINNSAMGLGMTPGLTKVVGSGPQKMIEAWHNTLPNTKVGQMAFIETPGFNVMKGGIKVDPKFRGQGYADELLDTFFSQSKEPRFGGTITNSPGYWQNLADKYLAKYPKFSEGLNTALDWARQDFGW